MANHYILGIGHPITETTFEAAPLVSVGDLSSDSSDAAGATANTEAIQAALDAGGLVTLDKPGTFYINDTLWLDDDTMLYLAPGVVLKQYAATNKLMVGTTTLQESATTVTITWTNGITASVAWTAHGRSAGDAICLQGATEVQWNTVYRVITITDANNLVIALPEFVSASPTGTITARRCVRNVGVIGTFDYDYTNNPSAAQGVDRHVCVIAFAADIPEQNLRVIAKNCYKYGLNTCATMNVRGSVHGIEAGDICKLYGPARDTWLSVTGNSRDDCASIQAKEPAAFLAYMPAYGPIKDCGFDGISVVTANSAASGAIVIYADTDHEIDNIVIRNGSALNTVNEAVAVKYGSGFSSGKVRQVTIENLTMAPVAGDYSMSVSCTVDVLNIIRPRIIPGTSAANNAIQLLRIESTATVRALTLDSWEFNLTDWPSSGAASYAVNLNGAVLLCNVTGCSFRGRSTARFMTIGTGGVESVAIRDSEFADIGQIGIVNDGASGTIRLILDNCRINNVTTGWDIRDDATVVMSGCAFTTMSNGVIRPTTNARTVNVYDLGGNSYSSASAITCASPGTAIPHGIELPVDVGATGITKAAGASAFNTGSGRGTLVQNRPVICDGTSWFQMTDLTKTF